MPPPNAFRFEKWFFGLVILGTALYAFIKRSGRALDEQRQLREAYRERDIATRRLPADFRFITHEMTLQEVIDRAGDYTNVIELPLREGADSETPNGRARDDVALVYEYALPYQAAVLEIPERPFKAENRIRAAVVRQVRGDEET